MTRLPQCRVIRFLLAAAFVAVIVIVAGCTPDVPVPTPAPPPAPPPPKVILETEADALGTIIQVTTTADSESFPTFLPAEPGTDIASLSLLYCAGGSIWKATPQGRGVATLITHGGGDSRDLCPSASPDGRQIVFYSNRGGSVQIWRANMDGTMLTRLTSFESGARNPAWSPDGSTIAFEKETSGGMNLGKNEVYLMTPDASQLTRLCEGNNPCWSPDSQQICYRWENDLWITGTEGGQRYKLTDTAEEIEVYPAWSPDGNAIAYQLYTSEDKITGLPAWMFPYKDPDIWMKEKTSTGDWPTGAMQLTATSGLWNQHPAWGPDGVTLVFCSNRASDSGKMDLFIAHVRTRANVGELANQALGEEMKRLWSHLPTGFYVAPFRMPDDQ